MKLIEPNVQEITDFEGVDNFYKAVARAARICYASDKTTDDKELCERLIESKHYSPFEHAIISIDERKLGRRYSIIEDIARGKYNKYVIKEHFVTDLHKPDYWRYYINGRTLVEFFAKSKFYEGTVLQNIDFFLRIIKDNNCEAKSIFKSFIVDTSIGCTREMNRHHDNFYIVEQSTRYCNFSKDKFGNEVAFNKPYWYDADGIMSLLDNVTATNWIKAMENAEIMYLGMLKKGVPTDIARGILPLDTHTRAIYTATLEEWNHIIDLRLKGTTGKPHGDIMIIADKIDKLIHHK